MGNDSSSGREIAATENFNFSHPSSPAVSRSGALDGCDLTTVAKLNELSYAKLLVGT